MTDKVCIKTNYDGPNTYAEHDGVHHVEFFEWENHNPPHNVLMNGVKNLQHGDIMIDKN